VKKEELSKRERRHRHESRRCCLVGFTDCRGVGRGTQAFHEAVDGRVGGEDGLGVSPLASSLLLQAASQSNQLVESKDL
jgi:hypothetical protein